MGMPVGFACWHPQWGGYASCCIVTCDAVPGACFDVVNWHDGEFPIGEHNPGPPDRKHYCSPLQLIEFGLDVLEEQLAASGQSLDGEDRDRLVLLRARLDAALTPSPPAAAP
jgi:hypothetical protein